MLEEIENYSIQQLAVCEKGSFGGCKYYFIESGEGESLYKDKDGSNSFGVNQAIWHFIAVFRRTLELAIGIPTIPILKGAERSFVHNVSS